MPPTRPSLGHRDDFPTLEGLAYLAHAAISPIPQAAAEAAQALLRETARLGLGALPGHLPTRTRLKERLGRRLGCRAEDIALTANTTSSLQGIAWSFPWEEGDRVLLFEGEFPANVVPWQQAARLRGLSVRRLPLPRIPDPDPLTPLEEALRAGARLVSVSAVAFQTGLRLPLQEISALCARHGAALCVDGIQAVGALPMEVAPWVDFLAGGSHKWLLGPEGVGYLYIHPRWRGRLRPGLAGWLSCEGALDLLTGRAGELPWERPLKRGPEVLESGSGNGLGIAALEASLTLTEELAPAAIHAHLQTYLDRLEEGLIRRGFTSLRCPRPEGRSGILSVLPPPGWTPATLNRALAEAGIRCSTPDGLLRMAPHWPNRLEEVPEVLAALDRILEGSPG